MRNPEEGILLRGLVGKTVLRIMKQEVEDMGDRPQIGDKLIILFADGTRIQIDAQWWNTEQATISVT